jgi:hypothetical protein
MSVKGAEGILAAKKAAAAKTPPPTAQPAPAPPPQADQGQTDKPDSDSKASKAGSAVGQAVGRPVGSAISFGNEAAGFVLGLIVWGWVVRPFLSGGVAGVKAVMMAKFFNKKPDGTPIP